MRIALVHDYLAQDGGAERVLKAMHEIWPAAPIFVLFHDKKKINYFKLDNIRESFLAKMPLIKTRYEWYLPLMPLATEKYALKNFDVIISSTSSFAKGVITHPHTLHISYCHTPPRYLWADSEEYISDLRAGRMVKIFLPRLIHKLRLWDKMSADRVDHFIANSRTVQRRIMKYYRRESSLVSPPVAVENFRGQTAVGDYFAAGGRLVPYKRLDLAVKAFNRLRWPLKIFGVGPTLEKLKKMAKPNIEFLGKINEPEKIDLLRGARAFIHPQLEDFGITPVESMAAGRPVIAYGQGGATETVIPGETGVFFPKQTWESLLDALLRFDHQNWDSEKIREQASKFNTENFKLNMQKLIADRYEEFQKGLSQVPLIR